MKTINVKYPVYFFATLFALILAGSEIMAGSGAVAAGKTEAVNYYLDGITGEISKESAVDLADWMVDLSAWNVFAFEEATEVEPGLENWMTDISAWDIYPFITEKETEPEIEQWMIDIGSWDIKFSSDCDNLYVVRHRKC